MRSLCFSVCLSVCETPVQEFACMYEYTCMPAMLRFVRTQDIMRPSNMHVLASHTRICIIYKSVCVCQCTHICICTHIHPHAVWVRGIDILSIQFIYVYISNLGYIDLQIDCDPVHAFEQFLVSVLGPAVPPLLLPPGTARALRPVCPSTHRLLDDTRLSWFTLRWSRPSSS